MLRTLLLSIFTVAFCFLPACNGCDTTTAPDGGTTSTGPDGGVGSTGSGLNVTSAAVRSCQVLFTTNGNEVPSVSFDEAVKGEFIPKAPRFSLAFAAKEDASIAGIELARFAFDGDAVAPSLTSFRCFDAAGVEVADALQLSQ